MLSPDIVQPAEPQMCVAPAAPLSSVYDRNSTGAAQVCPATILPSQSPADEVHHCNSSCPSRPPNPINEEHKTVKVEPVTIVKFKSFGAYIKEHYLTALALLLVLLNLNPALLVELPHTNENLACIVEGNPHCVNMNFPCYWNREHFQSFADLTIPQISTTWFVIVQSAILIFGIQAALFSYKKQRSTMDNMNLLFSMYLTFAFILIKFILNVGVLVSLGRVNMYADYGCYELLISLVSTNIWAIVDLTATIISMTLNLVLIMLTIDNMSNSQ